MDNVARREQFIRMRESSLHITLFSFVLSCFFMGVFGMAKAQDVNSNQQSLNEGIVNILNDLEEIEREESSEMQMPAESGLVENNNEEGSLVLTPETSKIVPTELIILRVVEDELQEIYKEDLFQAPDFPSLLFLPSEYAMLTAARANFVEQVPDEAQADEVEDLLPDEILQDIKREIKLGGIVYAGPDNWIVWINGQRVTPKALPEEVKGIKVRKEYVELQWEDKKTNTVFPIRLRPNQRFNLDARMFLPG